ncbi:MAG: PQ-loop domain-containing transporter [Actinomycetes bacterium]
MSQHSIALLAGFTAAFFTIIMVIPQAWKVWRDRSGVGVSLLTWAMFLCTYAMWFGYCIRTGNVAGTISNIFTNTILIVLVLGLLRARDSTAPTSVGVGIYALAVLFFVIGILFPMPVVLTLMLAATIIRVPQVAKSFTTMRDVTPSEVSILTWWIGICASTAWVIHGLLLPDVLFVITSGVAFALAIGVIVPEYIAQARRARLAG